VKANVETSLLTTKLNIPPLRPKMVPRPRLIERLKEGLSYNLVLVSAPAGFGKTTLLSEWVHQSQPRIRMVWISLDKGDNDPVRFWDYFITALQTIQSGCGQKILPLLHSAQPLSAELVLTALMNDLSSVISDFFIVLDDYHLIESQQIHDGVAFLLEHMPSRMHLIIASRADPTLPLANFRGKGMMLEIRTDDLRFSQDDATGLFKELKTPELSERDIAALIERTEGWVVGLKMAALSMKGQKDIPGFIASFTGSQRYIMDYLMEEVLQKQSPELRDFLIKTSVLERLTAPLCDAVTGRHDSQDTLLNLERGHLFIVPLDETRQWYRYEHLFADLLRHQLEVVFGPEKVTVLHRQASQWFEDNHLPYDAIHHALAARDWERAMRLIYTQCEMLRKLGEWNTLLGWLKIIPDELLRTHHRLYSQYASYLTVVSEFDAAEAALSYLEQVARDDPSLQGEVAFSLSNIARLRGDITRMIEMAEKALSLLPPDNIVMRYRALWLIGGVRYASGLFHEAEAILTEVYDIAQRAGDYWAAAGALNILGAIAHERGQLHHAAELFKRAIAAAGSSQIATGPQCKLGRVQYEWNDLEAAAASERLSTGWFESGGFAEGSVVAYFFLAQICLARGNTAGVAAAIEGMDMANRHPTVSRAYHWRHAIGHVVLAIRQHDLEAAAYWGRQMSEYSDVSQLEYNHVTARLLIAQGKKKAAEEYLADLHERMVRAGALGLAIGIRVYQALAANTPEEALNFLVEALVKGEPEGYIRTFVDEGELLKPLLEKALSRGIMPEYTRKLLTVIKAEERQRQARKGELLATSGLLSAREIEILRLVAGGLSNREIAERLFISLGTAKVHVHNLFEKLDVKSRTQVVARARELKLI
jgi:LuxR family maltose regulon positive regulatory protein